MTAKLILDLAGLFVGLATISVILVRPNTIPGINALFGGLSDLIKVSSSAGM